MMSYLKPNTLSLHWSRQFVASSFMILSPFRLEKVSSYCLLCLGWRLSICIQNMQYYVELRRIVREPLQLAKKKGSEWVWMGQGGSLTSEETKK